MQSTTKGIFLFMTLLIPIEDLELYKGENLIPLQCEYCKKEFKKRRQFVNAALKGNKKNRLNYCSIRCGRLSKGKGNSVINCKNCGQKFNKSNKEIERSKNHFCSRNCAGKFNNKHKIHGFRRSKLELFLEKELLTLFPNLEIVFNKRSAIGLELDIYIPSLKLAFELNGICHYKPIFGEKKFNNILNNDKNKIKICKEKEIQLFILNVSRMRQFTEERGKPILDFIIKMVGSADHDTATISYEEIVITF